MFLIALGAIVGTASVASAEKKCHSPSGSISCLSISHKGAGIFEVGVGIDVFLDPAEVQQILANPRSGFSASLMADDTGPNDVALVPLPHVSIGAAGGQLSANFGRDVGSSTLNEDNGTDELYARIFLFNADTNVTRKFETPVISIDI